MLYLIGLGLGDEKSLSVKSLEAIKSCDEVYLEHYTSKLNISIDKLENLYGKNIIIATRDLIEKEVENILEKAKKQNIAILVVGDVFSATTHHDLLLRAKQLNVAVKVHQNNGIISAVGALGLDLYKFGRTASVVFPDDNWYPVTPYNILKTNIQNFMHTLLLLDIKIAEPSKENLLKGINTPDKPRFMSVSQGLDVLTKLEENEKQGIISQDTLVIGIARLCEPDEKIAFGKLKDIRKVDFGKELHCIVIPSKLSEIELNLLNYYKV